MRARADAAAVIGPRGTPEVTAIFIHGLDVKVPKPVRTNVHTYFDIRGLFLVDYDGDALDVHLVAGKHTHPQRTGTAVRQHRIQLGPAPNLAEVMMPTGPDVVMLWRVDAVLERPAPTGRITVRAVIIERAFGRRHPAVESWVVDEIWSITCFLRGRGSIQKDFTIAQRAGSEGDGVWHLRLFLPGGDLIFRGQHNLKLAPFFIDIEDLLFRGQPSELDGERKFLPGLLSPCENGKPHRAKQPFRPPNRDGLHGPPVSLATHGRSGVSTEALRNRSPVPNRHTTLAVLTARVNPTNSPTRVPGIGHPVALKTMRIPATFDVSPFRTQVELVTLKTRVQENTLGSGKSAKQERREAEKRYEGSHHCRLQVTLRRDAPGPASLPDRPQMVERPEIDRAVRNRR